MSLFYKRPSPCRTQAAGVNYCTSPRNQNLDVLRGIAVLLVLGFHYDYFHVWARIGWCGVDLFFVLSGFLISGLLFAEYRREGQIDMRRFWVRRSFKIWPPYYVFIIFTGIFLLAEHRTPSAALLHDSLFVGNYLSHYWDHTWSLAVEEHFYLMLPVLLVAIISLSSNKSKPFSGIPTISVVVTVACFYLRSQALRAAPFSGAIALPTHLRIDSLFAGVTLGYYYNFEPDSFRRARSIWLWIGGCVLMAPVILLSLHGVITASTYTFTFIAFCCVVVCMVNRPPSNRVPARVLAFIGSYSYSIYLWHAALLAFIFAGLSPTLLLFSTYIFASIGLGVLMNKLIESPSLALRELCFPPRNQMKDVPRVSDPSLWKGRGLEFGAFDDR